MVTITNPLPRLRKAHRHNVETVRKDPLAEFSGSLGDLGTLLPILTALVISRSISLPATLLFTGAANIITGIAFGIPLPVQPMKAIAAVAIARKFTLEENAAAGIIVCFCPSAFLLHEQCQYQSVGRIVGRNTQRYWSDQLCKQNNPNPSCQRHSSWCRHLLMCQRRYQYVDTTQLDRPVVG